MIIEENMFCRRNNLSNEASVEMWFLNPLLEYLGFMPEDIRPKTSIQEFKIGKGSKSLLYKPDYIILINKFPTLIIDAKSPDENIEDWTSQCSSYCLELNKLYEHNPVEYFLLSNGLRTQLYKWDKSGFLIDMDFDDFVKANKKLIDLSSYISKTNLSKVGNKKYEDLMEANFELISKSLDEVSNLFARLHKFIRNTDKKNPSGAFEELMKIVFIKIKKDKELFEKIGINEKPKYKDVVFSVAWIKNQTEINNPVNDILFKNLIIDLEREIRNKNKKRIFNGNDKIDLTPSTIEKIVGDIEHINFYKMDEDIHGRMFESFLDATVRGPDLGQFFTPRDIVKLMVKLANIKITKNRIDSVLDACCGSGGFLIEAMNEMLIKVESIAGITNLEKKELKEKIIEKIMGIDAGSEPPLHRIARMNMYLHGDGGSKIYFADSLDKSMGQVGSSDLELDDELIELRKEINDNKKTFDVILSNPPFSLEYSSKHQEQKKILDQYITFTKTKGNSLLSSIMFLERYNDLVSKKNDKDPLSEDGRILAIIDDSVLSGSDYEQIRGYIRDVFIIKAVISLPGDAFKRSDSRVKTSILILRPKKTGEIQPDVFMEKAVYLGLTKKTAKRIGINTEELNKGKIEETNRIIKSYLDFEDGKRIDYIVSSENIKDRLDVKYCLKENSRRKPLWISEGYEVNEIGQLLKEAKKRSILVDNNEKYTFLKVTYGGEVIKGDENFGDEMSYSKLYRVHTWDILFSNIGVGRGAIGIVPPYCDNCFVSNEYTILLANSKEEALFYINLLRTKEILCDILSFATGMNRGRIRWEDMCHIEVPVYFEQKYDMKNEVDALESLWSSYSNFERILIQKVGTLVLQLKLEDEDSRLRWLAYKPPE